MRGGICWSYRNGTESSCGELGNWRRSVLDIVVVIIYAGSGFGAEMTYATSSVVHNLVSTTAVPINISQCISIYISLYLF